MNRRHCTLRNAGVPEVYRVTRGLKGENLQGAVLIGGQGRNRTTDTRIFSPLLYRLSYLAACESRIKAVSGLQSQDQAVSGGT